LVELETINMLVQIVGVSAAAIATVVGVRSYMISNKRAEEAKSKEQETSDRELETRQAQLLMQIWDKVNNKDFLEDWTETLWSWKWDTYEEYLTKYGSKPEKLSKLTHVLDTLSGIGVLLENGLVDPKMLYRILLQGWGPILYWEKYGPSLKEFGRRTGESRMYAGFEFLYNEFSRLYEEEHGFRYGHRLRSMGDALASVADDKNSTRT
jgi:hypothetical protein